MLLKFSLVAKQQLMLLRATTSTHFGSSVLKLLLWRICSNADVDDFDTILEFLIASKARANL